MANNKFEPIIGLEIHVELKTKSKMFCGCDANYFGGKPNTHTCPVCLGLPGALPVPNKKAIEWCIAIGEALNCEIAPESKFDRKNYFYPDLPKGYQISQYDEPLARHGEFKVKVKSEKGKDEEKTIRIRRVHMEEDTGKLIHATVDGKACTLIDFNRSGVPLVEVVTEPDFRNIKEVDIFLKKLQQIIRYLDVSNADLEKGSMRLEPSISLRPLGEIKLPNYRVEIKNINSFRFVRNALDAEIVRQTQNPKEKYQATRRYDEKTNTTVLMRSKEEAHDYRYFPEPDIPPIEWTQTQISHFKSQIPELPDARITRFMKDYQLSEYDASILVDDRDTSDYFEESIKYLVSSIKYKDVANWIINKKADISKVSPEELIKLILSKQQKPQINTNELDLMIKKMIEANPKAVADYKGGKEGTIMFLVGQVMRETKGKADASQAKQKIISMLK